MNDQLSPQLGIGVVEMSNNVMGPAMGSDLGVDLIKAKPNIRNTNRADPCPHARKDCV